MPFRASRLQCPGGHSRAFPLSSPGDSADLCSPAQGLGRPLNGAALGLGRGVLGGGSCPWPFENSHWEGESGLQRPREGLDVEKNLSGLSILLWCFWFFINKIKL